MKSHKKDYGDYIEWRNYKGELHREGGPAVEWADGDQEWFRFNRRHREDGPAIQYGEGNEEWTLNGDREWWIDDEELACSEFEEYHIGAFWK